MLRKATPDNPLTKQNIGVIMYQAAKGDKHMDDRQTRIAMLEQEIAALPIGYISRKNIRGKVKLYHQWKENGK